MDEGGREDIAVVTRLFRDTQITRKIKKASTQSFAIGDCAVAGVEGFGLTRLEGDMSTFEPVKADVNAPQQVAPPYNPYGAPTPGYQQQVPYQAAAASHPDAEPPPGSAEDDDDADSDAGARAPGTGIPLEYLDVS